MRWTESAKIAFVPHGLHAAAWIWPSITYQISTDHALVSQIGSFHPNSNFFVAEKNRNWWFFYSVFVMHRWCTLWNLRFLIQTGSCEIGIKVSGFELNLHAEIAVLLVFDRFYLRHWKTKCMEKSEIIQAFRICIQKLNYVLLSYPNTYFKFWILNSFR
jgi:hypothetical protein